MKTSDFKKEDELKKMNVADIKKHIRQFNEHYGIKGYSKLKKGELISAVLTAQNRISGNKTTKKKKLVIVEDKKPTPKKEAPKATPKKDTPKKEAPKKKQIDLTPREVFMRGEFTPEYKKELRNAMKREKQIPPQSWRGDDWVAKEEKEIKERLSKTIAFTNTPLFKVGDSVYASIRTGTTRRQLAKIMGLGKTISIKFDEDGTKRLIKYSDVVASDEDIRDGRHDTETILKIYGSSQIVKA